MYVYGCMCMQDHIIEGRNLSQIAALMTVTYYVGDDPVPHVQSAHAQRAVTTRTILYLDT
jgi:hypothetical protein